MLKKSRLSLVAVLTLLAMAFMPQLTMASSAQSNGQQVSAQRSMAQNALHHHPKHHHEWYQHHDVVPPLPPFPPFPPITPVASATVTASPTVPANNCPAGVRFTYNTLIPGATTVNVVVDDPAFATATVTFSGVNNVLQTAGPLAIVGGVITLTPPASLTLGAPTITLGVNTLTIGAGVFPLVSAGCA